MKRFSLEERVEQHVNSMDLSMDFTIRSCMLEDPKGTWVRWEDVEKEIEELENRILSQK